MKWFRQVFKRLIKHNKNSVKHKQHTQKVFSKNLEDNIRIINQAFGDSEDLIVRRFKIGLNQFDAALIHIDGLSDKTFIGDNILKPLTVQNPTMETYMSGVGSIFEVVKTGLLTACEIDEANEQSKVFNKILSGDTALFIEGYNKVLIISSRGFQNRGVQEPQTESVVRGPREGFSEPMRINTSLLRRRIKSPNLRFKTLTLGKQSNTNVTLVYLKGVCDDKIVREIENRLTRINTDTIIGAGTIEQFINDSPLSPFATVGNTERPDVAAGKIMEGRIAIIIDGTPIVLTAPHLFVEYFQTVDDYLAKPTYMTVIRWVRYIGFIITVFVPALYIALITFHPEMIPTQLLITMAASREGVPFPALVEALAMGITFEFLREAGIRMPRPVGQAVSIVGALVIGEAAVSAGLVGAPMVIITALTAITSFLTPGLIEVTTLLRFGLTIAAGTAGFYGIMLVTMAVFIHMVSLRSFGIPYFSPFAPFTFRDLKDVLVKVPVWAMDNRPRVIGYKNQRRQGSKMKPTPPKKQK